MIIFSYKELIKESIKKIVDEKFEGDYKKYISNCKSNGHFNSIVGLLELGLGVFVFTTGFLPTVLGILGGITMIKGYLNFKMVENIQARVKNLSYQIYNSLESHRLNPLYLSNHS